LTLISAHKNVSPLPEQKLGHPVLLLSELLDDLVTEFFSGGNVFFPMKNTDTTFDLSCSTVFLKHVFTLFRMLKNVSNPAVTTDDVRTIFKILTLSEKCLPSYFLSLSQKV
jgi:hypothetical protein